MFWILLLAHFIADYPFQPDWMVRRKKRIDGLALHVIVHLVVMLVIVGTARAQIWPYLSGLAFIHFWIDVGKNTVYRLRPKWIVLPYLIDQLCHYLSIGLVAWWIGQQVGTVLLPLTESASILGIGYLFATYVWFITERVLAHADAAYRSVLIRQLWPRMLTRGIILSGLLFLAQSFPVLLFAAPSAGSLPYFSGEYRLRALFTDLSVVVAVLIFIRLASGS
jgi:hypothetical protein